MRNVLCWLFKVPFCAGLGYLAWRYLSILSHWVDTYVFPPFNLVSLFVVLICYALFAMLVGKIDRKIGFGRLKPSIVRGVVCALPGFPTVAAAAVDFWKMTYSGAWTGGSYLVFVHLGFAALLFLLGYGPWAEWLKW